MATKKAARKGTKTGSKRGSKKRKGKKSPLLILRGEPTEEILKLLKGVQKNVPEPIGWGKRRGHWDHLIAALDKKDALILPSNIATAVATRGRKLGYVVKLQKQDDQFTEIWFGGFEGIPKEVKN